MLKTKRFVVTRIIMGPQSMFNRQLLEQDLSQHEPIRVWGTIRLSTCGIDIKAFLTELGLGEVQLHNGTMIRDQMPTDLTKPRNWTLSSFLSFAEETQAGVEAIDSLSQPKVLKVLRHVSCRRGI